ncbi:MAG: sulfatase-like hydrolase/transferase, partial [Deltaproteobacteria bacterium]|nr:sulfatase-like hydrolase/transferase [Deltaproteobacteria bacterium]
FNAPHSPLHVPPPEYRLTTRFADPRNPTTAEMHRAMMEVLDTELGRLLAHLKTLPAGERTTVIFLGDNGTQGPATEPPIRLDHAKGTLYEGGINVPLIIVSPLIAENDRGSESAALVSTRDIFATVAEIAGEIPALPRGESISVVSYLEDPSTMSQRALVHSEWFTPNGDGPYTHYQLAVRDRRYKLLRTLCDGETEEFYDLETDPYENANLLVDALTARQTVSYTILAAELDGKNRSCP